MVNENVIILYPWNVSINKMDTLAKERPQMAIRLPSVDDKTKY
jgi:hypothetical protein